ncbi:hypothetical protein J1N10_15070 [Carboxylicivirga sp. A043]|uniref:hypothetical protein n=1 Tax=Carboxylicivirga litoralis TaxID=2816963 RepID=UPI0021CB3488|nr:hypothetical protein [Carboxylicivirga sp. A043]MCU4157296.1 hypothetical protein [Carboxylicivirga sp. A043]
MKRKLLTLGLLLCLICTAGYSQDNEVSFNEHTGFKSNAVYFEGFLMNTAKYNFGYPSLNYERYLDKLYRLSIRIGISTDFDRTTNIPFSINWLTASLKHHHLEFGAGAILSINDYTYEDNNLVAYGIFLPMMYRYQKAGGLVIRAGANAIFGLDTFVAPSVSLGYNF